jgi:outer membrane protein insertion porin family
VKIRARCAIYTCVFLGWLHCYALLASSQPQGAAEPLISYEGQTVSSVELAGQPDLDSRKLRSLILQPAYAPYSQQKIEATIANLKQRGGFQDVKLDVTPEASGLRVLFVLQPAYYFGVFKFPEAANRFPYTRLLQAANYDRQEPYRRGRVEEAESNLLDFFHQTGFFLATVEPRLETDPAHRIVNVVFITRLKRHAHFGSIHFTGASAEENRRLERSLHSIMARIRGAYLKKGTPYSLKKLQKATTYLQGQLGKQHYLAGTVSMVSAKYDSATNHADVTFNIVTGPVVAIKIQGAHIWERTQKKIIPMYQENAVDPDLVHEGQEDLASYFQSKGFFDAKVTSRIEQQPSGTTVVYQVERGKRGKVTAVGIQGNQHLSGKELAPALTVNKARWYLPFISHGKYSSQLLRASVKRIEGAYKSAGYSQAKVTSQVTRKGGDVQVVFHVEEGARDFVDSLELQGNKSMTQAELAPKGLNLEAGKPYSSDLLNQDRDRILAHYLSHGFLNAVFRARIVPLKDDPHRVQVVYMIDEGPQVYTSVVVPEGAEHTRADTVKTNADIKAGKPLSETSLLQAESQLLGLGIFDWASVDTREPIADQPQAEVLIKVHESKRNTISYGFGFEVTNRGGKIPSGTVALPGLPPVGLPSNFETSQQTFWGPRGSITYTRNDLFGRAESMTLNALAGRLDQRASGSWLDPSFFNSAWISTFTISGERTSENPIFTSQQGQGSLEFRRYLDAKRTKSLSLRYSFTRTNLSNLLAPDLVLPEDRNVRLSTLSASYSRDTRDNPLDAHKGLYQSLELDLNPSALGSNTNFGRMLAQMSYYKTVFGKSTVWANSIRLGLEESFAGAHIPLSESFFSGGGSSLRGFPLNGAGPQRSVFVCGNPSDTSTCAQISVPVGGPQLVILNSELRFPLKIMSNLGGAVFYDGGNVFRSIGFGNFGSQYANSVGAGLRYSTPVGPIRIDVGHLVNSIPGVKSTQFFITLGQAF